MKKLYVCLVAVFLMLFPLDNVFASGSGFVIKDGVLTDYTGSAASIIIPEGVTEIGKDVFKNMRDIKSVVFPSTLAAVQEGAFWGVFGLTSVEIPKSVTYIGKAFEFCFGLEEVRFAGDMDNIEIATLAFNQTPWIQKHTEMYFSQYDAYGHTHAFGVTEMVLGRFFNGGFIVKKGGKYGIADFYGKEMIPCQYTGILPASNGAYEVEQNGIWSVYNQPEEADIYPPLEIPILAKRTQKTPEASSNLRLPVTLIDAGGYVHYLTESADNNDILFMVYDKTLTLDRSFSVKKEMGLFGGAAMDNDGNYYIAYGYVIEDKISSGESNLTIFKYSPTGGVLGSILIAGKDTSGSGTREPFNRGASAMEISNGVLAIYFGRGMFVGGDGLNHQASTALYADINTMERLDYPVPYASHSFDQAVIKTNDGSFLFADRGDAYPRGFGITKVNAKESFSFVPFHFRELNHYNATNSHLGGLAESKYGYLLAGSSERVLSNVVVDASNGAAQDLFIQIIRKDFHLITDDRDKIVTKGETRKTEGVTNNTGLNLSGSSYFLPASVVDYGVVWLTAYPPGEQARSPWVALTESGFILIWERWSGSKYQDTWYLLLNADGSVLKQASQIAGNPRVNENDGISYRDGKLYWSYINDGVLNLYIMALYDVPGIDEFMSQITANNGLIAVDWLASGFSKPLIEREGIWFYPLEDLLDALCGGYSWNAESFAVFGELNGRTVEVPLNAPAYWLNGEKRDVPDSHLPFVENERTYVYLDYIVEGLGLGFEYEDSIRMINTNNGR